MVRMCFYGPKISVGSLGRYNELARGSKARQWIVSIQRGCGRQKMNALAGGRTVALFNLYEVGRQELPRLEVRRRTLVLEDGDQCGSKAGFRNWYMAENQDRACH